MTQQDARAALKRYGSVRAVARETGVDRKTVTKLLNGDAPKAKPATSSAPRSVRTLADFRRTHDVRYQIRDGIKRLLRGDAYYTDAEFREALQANPARWRSAADSPEFEPYQIRVADKMHWARPETIREMRLILGRPE